MDGDIFLQRIFTIDGRETACRFFRPERHGRDFRCRYEIDWAEGSSSHKVFFYGQDEAQAFLFAMQAAHVVLLAARENDGRKISWLGQPNLGLPIPNADPCCF